MKYSISSAGLCCMLALPALGQVAPIQERQASTLHVNSGVQSLSISSHAGTLQFELLGPDGRAHATAPQMQLLGKAVNLNTSVAERKTPGVALSLRIKVPQSWKTYLEFRGANIDAQDVTGKLSIVDAGGNIKVQRVSWLKIDDKGGAISIDNAGLSTAGRVDIRDGTGDIAVRNVRGDLNIHDGAGDMVVENVEGDATVRDGSGAATIGRVSGYVAVEDGSGNLYLSDIKKLMVKEDKSGSRVLKNIGTSNIKAK